MRISRLLFAIVTFAALVALIDSPRSVQAAEFRSDDRTTVPLGATIDDDLYIAGGEVTIAGRVTGDVIVAAGEVDITGTIDGNLQILAGDLQIDGTVGGSVRALAGDVTVVGEVEGDVVTGSGTLTVRSVGRVGRDVVAAGGDVELLGPVGRDVRGNFGSLTINQSVGGDIDATVDDVSLLSRARIAGDLDYASRNDVSLADGATVAGVTRKSEPERFYPGDNIVNWLGSGLFRIFCALIAGLVLVLLMPRAVASVADAARLAPLSSLIFGLVLTIFLPILCGILLITIVGAPIAVIGFAVYFSVLYLSQVFLGLALGRIILPSSWDTAGRGYNLLAMAIGVLIVGGLRLVPLPFVSSIIAALTAVVGLGAFAVAIRTARKLPKMPAY
jgi:cytoskeletal protein CcmA (bactofilin family)